LCRCRERRLFLLTEARRLFRLLAWRELAEKERAKQLLLSLRASNVNETVNGNVVKACEIWTVL
jgi:hypothetical protein